MLSWQISIWNKNVQHHMLLVNYRLDKWDISTHLLKLDTTTHLLKTATVHLYYGTLFSDKRKWVIKIQNDIEET